MTTALTQHSGVTSAKPGAAGQLYTSQLQHCREGLLEISAYLAGG